MATKIEISHSETVSFVYDVYYSSDRFGEEIEVEGILEPLDTGRGNEFGPDYVFEGGFISDEDDIGEEILEEIVDEIITYFYHNQDKIT